MDPRMVRIVSRAYLTYELARIAHRNGIPHIPPFDTIEPPSPEINPIEYQLPSRPDPRRRPVVEELPEYDPDPPPPYPDPPPPCPDTPPLRPDTPPLRPETPPPPPETPPPPYNPEPPMCDECARAANRCPYLQMEEARGQGNRCCGWTTRDSIALVSGAIIALAALVLGVVMWQLSNK